LKNYPSLRQTLCYFIGAFFVFWEKDFGFVEKEVFLRLNFQDGIIKNHQIQCPYR